MRDALGAGYRHVDTAQAEEWYCEAEVGTAVADSGVRREELFLVTKQVRALYACECRMTLQQGSGEAVSIPSGLYSNRPDIEASSPLLFVSYALVETSTRVRKGLRQVLPAHDLVVLNNPVPPPSPPSKGEV